MESENVKYNALVISPSMAKTIPVTDINHVVREINHMRKAHSWITYERRQQRALQRMVRERREQTTKQNCIT